MQQRLLSRIDKLEVERDGLVVGSVSEDIEDLEETLATLDMTIEDKNMALDGQAEKVTELREEQSLAIEKRDNLRAELQKSRGRQASLEALQQAALGQTGGAVNEWLEKQGMVDFPRLAEKLSVSDGWDIAVETVLGKSLQAVYSDKSFADISEALGDLDRGELMVFGAAAASSGDVGDGSFLISKVICDVNLAPLLKGIYVANDLADAMAKQINLKDDESVITKDGLWLGSNWLRVAKEDDASSGVIGRQQELETLEEKIDTLESEIEALNEALEKVKLSLQDNERAPRRRP